MSPLERWATSSPLGVRADPNFGFGPRVEDRAPGRRPLEHGDDASHLLLGRTWLFRRQVRQADARVGVGEWKKVLHLPSTRPKSCFHGSTRRRSGAGLTRVTLGSWSSGRRATWAPLGGEVAWCGVLFDIDVSLKGYVGGLFARRIDVLDCLYIVL